MDDDVKRPGKGAAEASTRREKLKQQAKGAVKKLATERAPEVGGGRREKKDSAKRAEESATMGPPVNATLEPLTAPEETQFFAGAAGRSRVDELAAPSRRDGGPDGTMEDLVTGGSEKGVDDLVTGNSSSEKGVDDLVTENGDDGGFF